MEFEYLESQTANHTASFMYDTIYFQAPGDDYDDIESDLEDDEEDEDFDDRAEDLDDLHAIRVDDDINEPDAEDEYDITNPDPEDDHLPEEEDF
jgi:hypothetical protein